MSAFLKRWGALGGSALAGALVSLLALGLAQLARHDTGIVGQVTRDEHQDGRLAAAETWQREHDDRTKPLIDRFEKLDRKLDALFVWLRMVAEREGWPAPPTPAALNREPERGPRWMSEARADTSCKEACP